MKPLHGISKEGLEARVGRPKVWALGAERIRLMSKGYTFGDENVYVSQSKRIRFERKTYTFQARYTSWAGAEFASSGHGA